MNLIKKINALLLAVLVLLSTFSFNISIHYCQGNYKHTSFFGPAKSCHNSNVVDNCEAKSKSETKDCCHAKKEQQKTLEKDNCCHNKNILIEGRAPETTLANGVVVKPTAHEIMFDFAYNLGHDIMPFVHVMEKYKHHIYKPPLITTNILLATQTFLI